MTKKRIAVFVIFYVGVVIAILFVHFYILERYGHDPSGRGSDNSRFDSASYFSRTSSAAYPVFRGV